MILVNLMLKIVNKTGAAEKNAVLTLVKKIKSFDEAYITVEMKVTWM